MRSYDDWKATDAMAEWADYERRMAIHDDAETLLYHRDEYEALEDEDIEHA